MVIAAEAREFSGIFSRLDGVKRVGWARGVQFARWSEWRGEKWLFYANGAGSRCVSEALKEKMDVAGIINTGYCGALDPALKVGDIVVWGDAPRECPSRFASGEIISSDRVVVTAQEKRALYERTGAIAVEMEAGAAKEIAASWDVPFYCIRSVSDEASEDMPLDFNEYRDAEGRFALSKIALGAMKKPFTRIPALRKLEANCKIASESLGDFFADCRF